MAYHFCNPILILDARSNELSYGESE